MSVPFSNKQSSFSANGQTSAAVSAPRGAALLSLSGTFVATVEVEFSVDGGVSWKSAYESGNLLQFTAPNTQPLYFRVPCEVRLKTTAYTSGTVNYVLAGN